ncbi:hypothetical protein FT663_03215 [Candidozyma haemuli var. vulneris]|uniref:AMP-dependent synthetase/ligase domain-containing protein n=1 Tax=Candidozyma haemuli TaxID=45357 RepID=A0A2V1AWW6_9ASCO|nr:hypothetical protein CXQ85_004672 [[Candida] haemuloni]KAF3988720.1 hypothetical protein FT662_03248 [[Candida] haemuloni var. vulneris]KAF3990362.1 hypothetical protein FT663_03215 [[Candida] haemuloni var. vulneris]PVH22006.1 hypothetical protein CXQ85_004672 [[Candida] haemuloni]
MEDSLFTIAIASVLAVLFLYKNYLSFTRDVPPEYLSEQSVVDTIRNPGESAIYKSTKLDYSSGLRVGFGIRFDHYKVRNGNLCDAWEIMMYALEANPGKAFKFDDTSIELAAVNAWAQKIATYLRENNVEALAVPSSLFIASAEVFAAVVACFISQITVHVYDDKLEHEEAWALETDGGEVVINGSAGAVSVSSLKDTPSTVFENNYAPEKDKGIALVVTTSLGHNITATSKFAQINLIAAAASSLKHLPPTHELTADDRLLVVQTEKTAEAISNTVTKILAAFVSNANLYLTKDLDLGLKWDPTVISAPEDCVQSLYQEPSGIQKLFYWHRLFALTQLNFSNWMASKPLPNLRLVYAHKTINSGHKEWNEARAALSVHIIEELGCSNVAGPFLVTDFYDYRKVDAQKADKLVFRGCVVQAEEAKLADYDGSEPGIVCLRGHNIGRASTSMAGVGEKHLSPDSEGFFQIPKIKGNWGSDGCLYVYKS